jgi:hypothetical protein
LILGVWLAVMVGVTLAGLVSGRAMAQSGAAPPATAEIYLLLNYMGNSGCQFQRNGTWYPATEARDHLNRKLTRMQESKPNVGAEEFIEQVATKSSMSGQPYLVRCGNADAVESGVWLTRELQRMRRAGKPAKP